MSNVLASGRRARAKHYTVVTNHVFDEVGAFGPVVELGDKSTLRINVDVSDGDATGTDAVRIACRTHHDPDAVDEDWKSVNTASATLTHYLGYSDPPEPSRHIVTGLDRYVKFFITDILGDPDPTLTATITVEAV